MMKLEQSYHDWSLLGITVEEEQRNLEVTLGLNTQRVRIRFLEVTECHIDDFKMGNIVLDVEVFTNSPLSETYFEDSVFEELLGVSKETQYYQNIITRIEQGRLLYVEINPSYGCFAQIICEAVEEIQLS